MSVLASDELSVALSFSMGLVTSSSIKVANDGKMSAKPSSDDDFDNLFGGK